MVAEAVGEHGVERLVVDVAGTVVGGARPALVGDRQGVHQAEVMLLVEVVELAVVVAGAEVVGPLVAAAGEVELVRSQPGTDHDVALAATGDGHVLVVRGVALVDLLQAPGVEGQAVDLHGVQRAALEGLWQQAAVVGHDHRQLGGQGADLQGALRRPQLGGDPCLAIVVLGAAGLAVALEQAGAAAVGAGIELHPEQADGVDAETDGALGVTGLVAQEEALGPFLGLGLAGAFLAEITVEVEVAEFDAGLAVLDELGMGQGWDGNAGTQRGKSHGTGDRGHAHCYCLLERLGQADGGGVTPRRPVTARLLKHYRKTATVRH